MCALLCVKNETFTKKAVCLNFCSISERVPGKKRIQVMADSDSDSADCQTPKKQKLILTVKEKEERYMAAAKIMPHYDTMVCSSCFWRKSLGVWEESARVAYMCSEYGDSGPAL